MEKVLIILGSKSNIEVAEKAASVLKNSNVDYDMRICSAHRTPDMLDKILKGNYNVIIAIAGLAAHLPGVIASKTVVPVIGIPCKDNYEGLDALLSIAQMPPGIPVMCVGVERAEIAAINAIRIMRNYDKVNIVGGGKLAEKTGEILNKFGIPFENVSSPNIDTLNIIFAGKGGKAKESKGLFIYCPVGDKNKVGDSIDVMRAMENGLWVGLNRADNAAIVAAQIFGKMSEIKAYRDEMKKKVIADDGGLR